MQIIAINTNARSITKQWTTRQIAITTIRKQQLYMLACDLFGIPVMVLHEAETRCYSQ